MKRQRLPLWLLRDVPALLAVAFSFVPLMILAITSGSNVVAEGKIRPGMWAKIARRLTRAEACLDYALWRQAYRSLGWDHRAVTFTPVAMPEGWQDIVARFDAYCDAHDNLQAVADAYAGHLRAQYGLSRRAAHGSTDAARRAAAHHELVGVAPRLASTATLALILSSAQSARPSKDERGHVHPRGPPQHLKTQTTPPRTHPRDRALAPIPPSRTSRPSSPSAPLRTRHP